MVNEKNQPFNLEEWLESKKKGFSGKIPRADFIDKIKELATKIEQLKKEQQTSETQLKTSQTELTNRDQLITGKDKELQSKDKAINDLNTSLNSLNNELEKVKEKHQELTNKLTEQEQELKQRPEITNEKYQELLNNQEKHNEEDLKPANLPTNWEQELNDKKELEAKWSETQRKNKETETKLLAAEKQLNKKIEELATRPTTEQLQQAIQQAKDQYQGYQKLTSTEQEAINNYLIVKNERDKLKEALTQAQPVAKEIGINNDKIITEIQSILGGQIKKIEELITPLKSELTKAKQPSSKSSLELPSDYNQIKEENEELYEILKGFKDKIN